MADNQNQQLNTDQIRDLLSPYLDGEVTQTERVLVEQALAASDELQRELEILRRTVALVAALPPVPAPRPFTLTEADVKDVAPASKGFFGWSMWVKSVAGLAAALLCVVAAAGVFLTMQGGGSGSLQAVEVANAPTVSSSEIPAAAPQEAAPAESSAREEPAPAGLETEEALGQAAVAAPTPTAVATSLAALTESPADEVAKPAAPAGEAMTTDSEAYQSDQEMQPEQAPAPGAIEPTTLLRLEVTASPTPETPRLAAPAEEPAHEQAAAAEADVTQKTAESAPALTEEAAAGAAEAEREEPTTENTQAPEQPLTAESTELEQVLPTASPTATLPPEPLAPSIALLTPTVPVTFAPTAMPTSGTESAAPSGTSWWFGAVIAVIGLVVIAGLVIWLVVRNQSRAP